MFFLYWEDYLSRVILRKSLYFIVLVKGLGERMKGLEDYDISIK